VRAAAARLHRVRRRIIPRRPAHKIAPRHRNQRQVRQPLVTVDASWTVKGGPDIPVRPLVGDWTGRKHLRRSGFGALAKADACPTIAPGFDLAILGGNCFYELSTPEEQEGCIASASAALKPGGWVYVDNNHMEGELDESWRVPGVKPTKFPTGVCADGARVEGTSETVGFDAAKRLWRARRTITITFPDGRVTRHEYVHQKHPVSFGEVGAWLRSHGFAVEQTFGDRAGRPYSPSSDRAIFWARKP
jgi:hypothetical protein